MTAIVTTLRRYLHKDTILFWCICLALGVIILREAYINILRVQMSYAGTNEPKPFLSVNKVTGLTTYISNSGKFQISYPSDLIIHVNYVHVRGTNTYHPVSNVVELDSAILNRAPYVLIQYSQNLIPESVRDYVLNSSECEEVEDGTGETVYIGGVPGLLYKNITCSSKGETRLYFIKNKLEYNLIISGKPVDEAFLQNLISHFQFLP